MTVSAAIICKNEEDVIERCLNIILPQVDEVHICDTGSTDQTVQIIKDMNNPKVHVHTDYAWNKDFSEARNHANSKCTGKWIISVDCDNTTEFKRPLRDVIAWAEAQGAGVINATQDWGNCTFPFPKIYLNSSSVYYKYKFHNVLHHNCKAVTSSDIIMYEKRKKSNVPGRKKRQTDLQDYFNDMNVKEPGDARCWFYAARTYMDNKAYDKAIPKFTECAKISKWSQERYVSYLYLGRCYKRVGEWEKATMAWMRAWETVPERAEAQLALVREFKTQKMYKTAVAWWDRTPRDGIVPSGLFVESNAYTWETADETSLVFNYMNDPKKAVECAHHAFSHNACPRIQRNLDIYKKRLEPVTLIYTGVSRELWNIDTLEHRGVGGSETVAAQLAKEIGAWVSGDVIDSDELRYVHRDRLQTFLDTNNIERIIVSRYIDFFERYTFDAKKVFLWQHDCGWMNHSTVPTETIFNKWGRYIDGVVTLSDWQMNLTRRQFPQLSDVLCKIPNGIDRSCLGTGTRVKHRFGWTSCINRGLDKLLEFWPTIKEKYPDAELHVASYSKKHKVPDGVVYHGSLCKKDLYELISTFDVWFYPATFPETFCCTAVEMMMHNVRCLAWDVAALKETIGTGGVMVKTLDDVFGAMDTPQPRDRSGDFDWKNVVPIWKRLFDIKLVPMGRQDIDKHDLAHVRYTTPLEMAMETTKRGGTHFNEGGYIKKVEGSPVPGRTHRVMLYNTVHERKPIKLSEPTIAVFNGMDGHHHDLIGIIHDQVSKGKHVHVFNNPDIRWDWDNFLASFDNTAMFPLEDFDPKLDYDEIWIPTDDDRAFLRNWWSPKTRTLLHIRANRENRPDPRSLVIGPHPNYLPVSDIVPKETKRALVSSAEPTIAVLRSHLSDLQYIPGFIYKVIPDNATTPHLVDIFKNSHFVYITGDPRNHESFGNNSISGTAITALNFGCAPIVAKKVSHMYALESKRVHDADHVPDYCIDSVYRDIERFKNFDKQQNLLVVCRYPVDWGNDGFEKAVLGLGMNIALADPGRDRPDYNGFDHVIFKQGFSDKRSIDAYADYVKKYGKKHTSSICISSSHVMYRDDLFDHLFYETEWYRRHAKMIRGTHAFGLNTDFIRPMDVPKEYDWLMIGAVIGHKNPLKFLEKPGKKLWLGHVCDEELAKKLTDAGVVIKQVPYSHMAKEISKCKRLFCTCGDYGGGERAVLEARACGLEIELIPENTKLPELLGDDVVKWNHKYYAEQIRRTVTDQ
mgnify:CR=1 FL=1